MNVEVREQQRCAIIKLIWLYLALLIVEGALRKWIVPQFSDALLVVRDPVALAIIVAAFLHPPLLFVIGRVLTPRELRQVLMVIVAVMVPVAALMVEQFRADSMDWINRGASAARSGSPVPARRRRPGR